MNMYINIPINTTIHACKHNVRSFVCHCSFICVSYVCHNDTQMNEHKDTQMNDACKHNDTQMNELPSLPLVSHLP